MEPKGDQKVTKREQINFQKHHLRNRFKKMTKKGGTVADFLELVLIKLDQNSFKKRIPKTITKTRFNAKGVPKWSQIDAKTHQKSMPKQVNKKIMKIIKNHVSLHGKLIHIHCEKNICV